MLFMLEVLVLMAVVQVCDERGKDKMRNEEERRKMKEDKWIINKKL